jgi:hypothetical protein
MSKCIAVLTRGYNNMNQYEDLINRNIHISDNLVDKSIDILIFHEGNISKEHQIFIDLKKIFYLVLKIYIFLKNPHIPQLKEKLPQ